MKSISKQAVFKKEALNLKTFKRVWPILSKDFSGTESIEVDKAFDLYQKGLLKPSELQTMLEVFDRKNSLHFDRGSIPGENEPGYREMEAWEKLNKEKMMSGRHGGKWKWLFDYADTTKSGYDPSGDPVQTLYGTTSVDPTTGGLPLAESGEWKNPNTTWSPYILVYKGTDAVISRQFENPEEARWVSSHPDLSSGYAKKGREGFLEVYDLRKILKEKRTMYSKHVRTDTRGMNPEDVIKLRLGGKGAWRNTPFYEMVISDEALHKARIAKYKSLPGTGWMLVEGRNVLKYGLNEEEATEGVELLAKDAELFAKENPALFFYYNFDQFNVVDEDLIDTAVNNLAIKQPEHFLSNSRAFAIGIHNLDSSTVESLKNYLNELVISDSRKYLELDYYKQGETLGLKDLTSLALKNFSETNPKQFLDGRFVNVAKDMGLIDIIKEALNNFAVESPKKYLDGKYVGIADSISFIDSTKNALIKLSKWSLKKYFEGNYHKIAEESGAGDVNRQIFNDIVNSNPSAYLDSGYDKIALDLGIQDLTRDALRNIAINDPNSFIKSRYLLAKDLGFQDLIELALKTIAEQSPKYYFNSMSHMKAKSIGYLEANIIALTNLAKNFPDVYNQDKYKGIIDTLGISPTQKAEIEKNLLSASAPLQLSLEKESYANNSLIKLARTLNSFGLKYEADKILKLI